MWEMSDYELVKLDESQAKQLDDNFDGLNGALNKLTAKIAPNDKNKTIHQALTDGFKEVTKWQAIQDETIRAGFASVVEAIAKISTQPPPLPKPKGVIMATFKVAADNPDIVIELSGTGFTDSEGNPTGAGDIDLSVESSNNDVLEATLSGQTVSDDGQTVTAQVNLHFGAASPDMAALAYKANNRDTGALVAAGSDEFIVGAGEASVGSITSTVPLTPEP